MAENPVEFDYRWFEVFLEDIDHHIVCAGAQRIIVELRGNAAHDLVGPAPVAAAGALDAQFARREDGDRLVDTAFVPLPMPPVTPTFIIPFRRENLSREPRR